MNIRNNKEANEDINNVGKEKGLESKPSKEQIQAPQQNSSADYTKPKPQVCQEEEEEKYPLRRIHQIFKYDSMVAAEPDDKDDIDAVMDVIYDTMNSSNPKVRVNGEYMPRKVVVERLLGLNVWSIPHAIEQFYKQSEDVLIKYPKAYMLSVLYNTATGGYQLGLKSQVKYDMAHWLKFKKLHNID